VLRQELCVRDERVAFIVARRRVVLRGERVVVALECFPVEGVDLARVCCDGRPQAQRVAQIDQGVDPQLREGGSQAARRLVPERRGAEQFARLTKDGGLVFGRVLAEQAERVCAPVMLAFRLP